MRQTALQQAMLMMSVEAQAALRDKRGIILGTKVDMRVNALGKKKVLTRFYTHATRVGLLRPYQQDNGGVTHAGSSGDVALLRRDAVRAR